ncbi:MAG: peptidase dimerization domain-containing protein [Erysipelotrichaceae bacterium]|nr:peptidase dimerization domain-containing protein [Erysipelotrichaceae bacterium]
MKNTLDQDRNELYALGDELFIHPQLGYKEFTNKKILTEYFESHGLRVTDLGFRTAFKVSVGSGSPRIGLIAELDAIPTLGHPFANKDDYAAHSCGHSTQCAIMAYTLVKLKDIVKKGTVTLYFTPAEEFTDIAFRKQLIRKGEIRYIGGKVNMQAAGQFDEEDLLIHLHTMGQSDYHFSLNSALSGFVYKEITFKGKATHAAVAPDKGINALNAFVLFDNALNMLRETFREEDFIRIHGILSTGGQTVNSIPEKTVYECYVRSMNEKALRETAARVDNAAKCCAKAIGASVSIRTTPGYLPMHQNRAINDIIRKNMLKYCKPEEIHDGEISMAAGDIGDLSLFKPTVQFGYSGFAGNCHGKDLCIVDKQRAYLEPAKIVYDTVKYLLDHEDYVNKIKQDFTPAMTKEEYLAYLG